MDKIIKSLKNHIIICGLGELGEEVVRNLKDSKKVFTVIESSTEEIERVKMSVGDFNYIIGDASQLNVLSRANIDKAKTLITCLGTDSQNLFVVITARDMNHLLTIVTEAIDKDVNEKLRRAGADYIISPSQIGGRRMACVATSPAVVSFLDVITSQGDSDLHLESYVVEGTSSVVSKTLEEAAIPLKTGIKILSVKKKEKQQFIYNPSSRTKLEKGDEIIVIGQQENLAKLKKYIK